MNILFKRERKINIWFVLCMQHISACSIHLRARMHIHIGGVCFIFACLSLVGTSALYCLVGTRLHSAYRAQYTVHGCIVPSRIWLEHVCIFCTLHGARLHIDRFAYCTVPATIWLEHVCISTSAIGACDDPAGCDIAHLCSNILINHLYPVSHSLHIT